MNLAGEKVQMVEAPPLKDARGMMSADDYTQSKRRLFVTPFKGEFFKRCPGARPGLLCCNYFVLNLGQQCDMDCSYCYLQSFLNYPALTLYSNIDQAITELKDLHNHLGDQKVRVGTGEVVDSLSLDPITLYSRKLIELFNDFPNWTLEFKTKSAQVDQFLDMPHKKNVLVSWSLNPQNIIAQEEHGTASLEARLQAAERCAAHGFPLAFHLDPMIYHSEWKDSYANLVDAITSRFTPDQVQVMSVGALRFQPEQRHLMRRRFGLSSLVNQAELFQSSDGKLRYDRRLRTEMYDFILKRFREHNPLWRMFLCMESHETWLAIDDTLPHKQQSLKDLFDSTVIRKHRMGEHKWEASDSRDYSL